MALKSVIGQRNSTQNERNRLMEKLFARNAIVHDRRFGQMHDRNHRCQMMGKKAAILSSHRAENHVACSFSGVNASVDFVQAAIEVRVEKVAREIAVFEAT